MSGPGYLFSLPEDFFDSVDCVSDGTSPEAPSRPQEETIEPAGASCSTRADAWSEGMGATCIACGIGVNSQGFTSSAEQRQHFKTDWHRYNVKRRLEKKPPVTEAAFDAMIEQQDDVSSISGSDTDDSSESDMSDDEEATEGQLSGSSRRGYKGQLRASTATVQGPQVLLQTQDGEAFAVWRCLLLPDSQKQRQDLHSQQQLLHLLKQLRGSAAVGGSSSGRSSEQAAAGSGAPAGGGCVWAVFMLRGGHFAGAVVRMNTSSSSSRKGSGSRQTAQQSPAAAPCGTSSGSVQGQGSSSSSSSQPSHRQGDRGQAGLPPGPEPFTVLAHKTFHRYVVRAKAGGKQSTKDGTGKFARSAGSRLRRYNEAALSRDIRSLVKEWEPWLAAARLIFVAAPGSNSRVLFDAAAEAAPPGRQGLAGHPLDPADPRVRRVPFVTQRPTFSELKRTVWVLASVRPLTLPPTQPPQQEMASGESQQQDTAQQQRQQEQQQREAAAAAAIVVPPMPPAKKQEDPPLIKASKAGDAERVSRLLANGHDPTVRDAKGRSPYQLAASKEVRDAFRRYMAQAPDAWDYTHSDIPSPLTDELEAAQQSKKADKRARQRAKDKERKEGKTAAGGSSSSKGTAAAADGGGGSGGGDSFDAELAAAMAEAAAISSRSSASSKAKQVGGSSSSRKGGGGSSGSAAAAAAARAPSAEEVACRREQLAAAAEARLKALQQKQQLW